MGPSTKIARDKDEDLQCSSPLIRHDISSIDDSNDRLFLVVDDQTAGLRSLLHDSMHDDEEAPWVLYDDWKRRRTVASDIIYCTSGEHGRCPNVTGHGVVADKQYDGQQVVVNQELIIEKIQNLNAQLAQHDDDMKETITASKEELAEALESLYAQVRKSSLRHRLGVASTLSVGAATALSIVALFMGNIIIPRPVPFVLLLAAIGFWFMARQIPAIPSLEQATRTDDTRTDT